MKDVSQLVLSRRTRMCNFLEYKGTKNSSICGSVALTLWVCRPENCLPSLRVALFHRRWIG